MAFDFTDYNAKKGGDINQSPNDTMDDSFTRSMNSAWHSAGGSGDSYGNYMNKNGASKLWGNASWESPGQRQKQGGMYSTGYKAGKAVRGIGGFVAGGIKGAAGMFGNIGKAWENHKKNKTIAEQEEQMQNPQSREDVRQNIMNSKGMNPSNIELSGSTAGQAEVDRLSNEARVNQGIHGATTPDGSDPNDPDFMNKQRKKAKWNEFKGKFGYGKGQWAPGKLAGGAALGGLGMVGKAMDKLTDWNQDGKRFGTVPKEQFVKSDMDFQEEYERMTNPQSKADVAANAGITPVTGQGQPADPDATFGGSAEMWADNRQSQQPDMINLGNTSGELQLRGRPESTDWSGKKVEGQEMKQNWWQKAMSNMKQKRNDKKVAKWQRGEGAGQNAQVNQKIALENEEFNEQFDANEPSLYSANTTSWTDSHDPKLQEEVDKQRQIEINRSNMSTEEDPNLPQDSVEDPAALLSQGKISKEEYKRQIEQRDIQPESSEDPYGDWLDMNPEQKEKQSRETALEYKDDILGDNNSQGWNIKDLVGERASDMEDIEQQKRENLDDGTTQPPSTPITDDYNNSSNTVKQLQGLEGLSQQLQDSSYDFNTVPDSVVQAITQVETGGASQDSLDAAFKREGAVGSMQQRQIFQDEIARLDPSMKGYDPNDPEQAQKAAKIYIAHQMKSGSDLDTAIRAYNAGRGGARKGLGGDYLNKVRRAYEQKERDYMNPVGYQPTVANESQDNSIFLQPSPIDSAWSNTMFKKGDYK